MRASSSLIRLGLLVTAWSPVHCTGVEKGQEVNPHVLDDEVFKFKANGCQVPPECGEVRTISHVLNCLANTRHHTCQITIETTLSNRQPIAPTSPKEGLATVDLSSFPVGIDFRLVSVKYPGITNANLKLEIEEHQPDKKPVKIDPTFCVFTKNLITFACQRTDPKNVLKGGSSFDFKTTALQILPNDPTISKPFTINVMLEATKILNPLITSVSENDAKLSLKSSDCTGQDTTCTTAGTSLAMLRHCEDKLSAGVKCKADETVKITKALTPILTPSGYVFAFKWDNSLIFNPLIKAAETAEVKFTGISSDACWSKSKLYESRSIDETEGEVVLADAFKVEQTTLSTTLLKHTAFSDDMTFWRLVPPSGHCFTTKDSLEMTVTLTTPNAQLNGQPQLLALSLPEPLYKISPGDCHPLDAGCQTTFTQAQLESCIKKTSSVNCYLDISAVAQISAETVFKATDKDRRPFFVIKETKNLDKFTLNEITFSRPIPECFMGRDTKLSKVNAVVEADISESTLVKVETSVFCGETRCVLSPPIPAAVGVYVLVPSAQRCSFNEPVQIGAGLTQKHVDNRTPEGKRSLEIDSFTIEANQCAQNACTTDANNLKKIEFVEDCISKIVSSTCSVTVHAKLKTSAVKKFKFTRIGSPDKTPKDRLVIKLDNPFFNEKFHQSSWSLEKGDFEISMAGCDKHEVSIGSLDGFSQNDLTGTFKMDDKIREHKCMLDKDGKFSCAPDHLDIKITKGLVLATPVTCTSDTAGTEVVLKAHFDAKKPFTGVKGDDWKLKMISASAVTKNGQCSNLRTKDELKACLKTIGKETSYKLKIHYESTSRYPAVSTLLRYSTSPIPAVAFQLPKLGEDFMVGTPIKWTIEELDLNADQKLDCVSTNPFKVAFTTKEDLRDTPDLSFTLSPQSLTKCFIFGERGYGTCAGSTVDFTEAKSVVVATDLTNCLKNKTFRPSITVVAQMEGIENLASNSRIMVSSHQINNCKSHYSSVDDVKKCLNSMTGATVNISIAMGVEQKFTPTHIEDGTGASPSTQAVLLDPHVLNGLKDLEKHLGSEFHLSSLTGVVAQCSRFKLSSDPLSANKPLKVSADDKDITIDSTGKISPIKLGDTAFIYASRCTTLADTTELTHVLSLEMSNAVVKKDEAIQRVDEQSTEWSQKTETVQSPQCKPMGTHIHFPNKSHVSTIGDKISAWGGDKCSIEFTKVLTVSEINTIQIDGTTGFVFKLNGYNNGNTHSPILRHEEGLEFLLDSIEFDITGRPGLQAKVYRTRTLGFSSLPDEPFGDKSQLASVTTVDNKNNQVKISLKHVTTHPYVGSYFAIVPVSLIYGSETWMKVLNLRVILKGAAKVWKDPKVLAMKSQIVFQVEPVDVKTCNHDDCLMKQFKTEIDMDLCIRKIAKKGCLVNKKVTLSNTTPFIPPVVHLPPRGNLNLPVIDISAISIDLASYALTDIIHGPTNTLINCPDGTEFLVGHSSELLSNPLEVIKYDVKPLTATVKDDIYSLKPSAQYAVQNLVSSKFLYWTGTGDLCHLKDSETEINPKVILTQEKVDVTPTVTELVDAATGSHGWTDTTHPKLDLTFCEPTPAVCENMHASNLNSCLEAIKTTNKKNKACSLTLSTTITGGDALLLPHVDHALEFLSAFRVAGNVGSTLPAHIDVKGQAVPIKLTKISFNAPRAGVYQLVTIDGNSKDYKPHLKFLPTVTVDDISKLVTIQPTTSITFDSAIVYGILSTITHSRRLGAASTNPTDAVDGLQVTLELDRFKVADLDGIQSTVISYEIKGGDPTCGETKICEGTIAECVKNIKETCSYVLKETIVNYPLEVSQTSAILKLSAYDSILSRSHYKVQSLHASMPPGLKTCNVEIQDISSGKQETTHLTESGLEYDTITYTQKLVSDKQITASHCRTPIWGPVEIVLTSTELEGFSINHGGDKVADESIEVTTSGCSACSSDTTDKDALLQCLRREMNTCEVNVAISWSAAKLFPAGSSATLKLKDQDTTSFTDLTSEFNLVEIRYEPQLLPTCAGTVLELKKNSVEVTKLAVVPESLNVATLKVPQPLDDYIVDTKDAKCDFKKSHMKTIKIEASFKGKIKPRKVSAHSILAGAIIAAVVLTVAV